VKLVRRATELLSEAYKSGEVTDEMLALCARDFKADASRRVFNPATYDEPGRVSESISRGSRDSEGPDASADRFAAWRDDEPCAPELFDVLAENLAG
jgi:hypothetical protein